MDDLALRLRARLLPALLAALGVALLTAGLLTYTVPVEAGPESFESPTIVTLAPTAAPPVTPRPTGGPSGETPDGPSATPTATVPPDRVATRVVIAALGIDLPIVKPPSDTAYPLCDVAMYTPELSQPGLPGATYIYAHARTGMFLPLLEASKIDNGAKMLGLIVEVYTSDNQVFLYEVYQVRRHVPFAEGYDAPFAVTASELWLQTSEGVGKQPKLQIVARLLSMGSADPAAANPVPRPRVCG